MRAPCNGRGPGSRHKRGTTMRASCLLAAAAVLSTLVSVAAAGRVLFHNNASFGAGGIRDELPGGNGGEHITFGPDVFAILPRSPYPGLSLGKSAYEGNLTTGGQSSSYQQTLHDEQSFIVYQDTCDITMNGAYFSRMPTFASYYNGTYTNRFECDYDIFPLGNFQYREKTAVIVDPSCTFAVRAQEYFPESEGPDKNTHMLTDATLYVANVSRVLTDKCLTLAKLDLNATYTELEATANRSHFATRIANPGKTSMTILIYELATQKRIAAVGPTSLVYEGWSAAPDFSAFVTYRWDEAQRLELLDIHNKSLWITDPELGSPVALVIGADKAVSVRYDDSAHVGRVMIYSLSDGALLTNFSAPATVPMINHDFPGFAVVWGLSPDATRLIVGLAGTGIFSAKLTDAAPKVKLQLSHTDKCGIQGIGIGPRRDGVTVGVAVINAYQHDQLYGGCWPAWGGYIGVEIED